MKPCPVCRKTPIDPMPGERCDDADCPGPGPDIYVIETPRGFTESLGQDAVLTLERLGIVRHVRDDHVMADGDGNGIGPLHRFYGPA